MSFLVSLSQKVSPFQCCRQPINIKKQLNLYQTQLSQPLKVNPHTKTQTLQKIIHINNFYQSPKSQNSFKMIQKSQYDQFKKLCENNHEMFVDNEFRPCSQIVEGIIIEKEKKIIWRRLSQMYNKGKYCVVKHDTQQQAENLVINELSHSKSSRIQFTPIKSSPFMSILQLIRQKPTLIQQIFKTPSKQQQQLNNFGIYRLILNDHGYAKQIIIDDYVPLYINTDQHILSHPHHNQLWPIILEKSLAKLAGSYSKLHNRMKAHQILRLLTPAPTVKHQLHISQSSFKQTFDKNMNMIREAILNKLIVCCTSRIGIQNNKRIKPQHTYSIIEVQISQKLDQCLIVLLDPLYDDDDTQSVLSKNSQQSNLLSRNDSFRQIFKVKYGTFVKYFSQFSICYFQQHLNMDFEKMQLQNRKPQYIQLQVKQRSDVIVIFSRVKRRFIPLSMINLSQVTNQIRNIFGIRGGWLKVMVARQKSNQNEQTVIEYLDGQIQTEDSTLSIHFNNLQPGQYVIYLQGYSEQNQNEFYSFSVCSKQPFFIKKQPSQSHNNRRQYFLEEIMLNHCLKSQQQQQVTNNYFIQNDNESWYVSNFLYKNGAFGYLVIYLSKQCKFFVEIRIDLEKIYQEGYKLECKKVMKEYRKVLKPGNADVIVFSLNYKAKKYLNTIQFPPKSIIIETFETFNQIKRY